MYLFILCDNIFLLDMKSAQLHGAGSSVNSAICVEISKFCQGFTMVVYEKIFGTIKK